MVSRLTIRQVSKLCPSCYVLTINSFTANQLRFLFGLKSRPQYDRCLRKRGFYSTSRMRVGGGKGSNVHWAEKVDKVDEVGEKKMLKGQSGLGDVSLGGSEDQVGVSSTLGRETLQVEEWKKALSTRIEVEKQSEVLALAVVPVKVQLGLILEIKKQIGVANTSQGGIVEVKEQSQIANASKRETQKEEGHNGDKDLVSGGVGVAERQRKVATLSIEGIEQAGTQREILHMTAGETYQTEVRTEALNVPMEISIPLAEKHTQLCLECQSLEDATPITQVTKGEEKVGNKELENIGTLPWYLQEEYVRPRNVLLPERAPLPPLPDAPPPALAELITYLDSELGINDIQILDLREVEPTPALGKEIIMIFGSARSERHLHISADSVCRWLRSSFGMKPHADGLIGRNELKLVNRRKIRRGKVSASQVGVEDEATKTEWVCVNVASQGLVIQLFTPLRREELQLEALWEQRLKTSRKNKEQLAQILAQLESFPEKDLEVAKVSNRSEDSFQDMGQGVEGISLENSRRNMTTASLPPYQSQIRHFHSSREQCGLIVPDRVKKTATQRFRAPYIFSELLPHLPPSLINDIKEANYTKLNRKVEERFTGPGDPQSLRVAVVLFAHVMHLQKTRARELLGKSVFDTTSTPFIRSFFQTIPAFPEPIHYHAWLSFLIQANSMDHQAYPATCFMNLLMQMKASGAEAPRQFYIDILEALAVTKEFRQISEPEKTTPLIRETTNRMLLVIEVLEDMSRGSGYSISSPTVYNALFKGLFGKDIGEYRNLAMSISTTDGTFNYTGVISLPASQHRMDRRVFYLEKLMIAYGIKQKIAEFFENYLTALAMARYWIGFWNRWKDVHYNGLVRDARLYKLVLGLVALSQDQNEAANALRLLQDSMSKEEIPVVLDKELARSFVAVVNVALGGQLYEGPYSVLLRECEFVMNGKASLGGRS